jgi:hypothetical protein
MFCIAALCAAGLLVSCKSGKPDISNIIVPDVEIQRLDRDIFTASADELHRKYGAFFDFYTEYILDIGNFRDSLFTEYFEMFKTSGIVMEARNRVDKQYPDLKELCGKLTLAMKYYRYYFPDRLIPKIYTYIAGFNHSFILTDSVLAIGLDKYLGADCKLYDDLRFNKYMSRHMHREKIVSDFLSTLVASEWVLNGRQNNDLISKMLYEGKILYATDMILPDEADTLIFGFSADQLRWCKNNEKTMWVTLIENKRLYSTDYLIIKKLTEPAPNTSEFTSESPGKACNWIGYNIIAKYMKNNPQTSLRELMDDNDYHRIFAQAKYKP